MLGLKIIHVSKGGPRNFLHYGFYFIYDYHHYVFSVGEEYCETKTSRYDNTTPPLHITRFGDMQMD